MWTLTSDLWSPHLDLESPIWMRSVCRVADTGIGGRGKVQSMTSHEICVFCSTHDPYTMTPFPGAGAALSLT